MMDYAIADAVQILRRTPETLTALLGGLDDRWVRANEGADTFSPFDVVGHLIDGEEEDWIGRARLILDRGPSVRFSPFDRFRHRARNQGRSMDTLLEEFRALRMANVDTLESWQLTAADLALPGEHPSFGAVTLSQLLATWVAHDLGHVAQVARVMAKQYRAAVGPWIEFLPVLTDHETPRS